MNKARFNPLGIQMISEVLHRRIYGNRRPRLRAGTNVESIVEQLKKSIDNIEFTNTSSVKDSNKNVKNRSNDNTNNQAVTGALNYPFEMLVKHLPPLRNNDVLEHVEELGRHFSAPYLRHVYDLLRIPEEHINHRPNQWSYTPGWTRYTRQDEGSFRQEKVDYPLEDSIVFDVEICMEARNKNKPTLAVALTPTAWYSWTSDSLINFCDSDASDAFSFVEEAKLCHMIPMGDFGNLQRNHGSFTEVHGFKSSMGSMDSTPKRLIVGHNVSFDRSYIKEQYDIAPSSTRFLDTMSLHIAVSGQIQEQRIMSLKVGSSSNPWSNVSSLNNLADVYQLYCKPKKGLDKDARDIFVKGTMKDVQDNYQNLVDYCASDVAVTLKVLRSLFPLFVTRFPSPASFSGMLEMSTMYLPTNRRTWKRYVDESQSIYEEFKEEINQTLKGIACDSCGYLVDEKYKKDPWLSDLDWNVRQVAFKKSAFLVMEPEKQSQESKKEDGKKKIEAKKKEVGSSKIEIPRKNVKKKPEPLQFWEMNQHLKKNQPLLPGYPQWFLEFCGGSKTLRKSIDIDFEALIECTQPTISPKLRVVPKLLKLTWKGYPLHFNATWGWGFLVPLDLVFPDEEFPIDGSGLEFEPMDELRKVIENTKADLEELKNLDAIRDIVPGCVFYKLPHKMGPSKRVGNPLGKDFLSKIADGTLKPYHGEMANLVNQQNKISYWTNSSKRILSQIHLTYDQSTDDGAILPRVVVSGTITRRAVEPTWLTASNSYNNRLGSELKGIIQCPRGYSYVGADVDSQELWIASLIGDAHFSGIQGSTGLGWMTLRGERSLGTDMHSVTANAINISRDDAKVLNYARIYGSGQDFAARFLKQSNPSLSEESAKQKASKIFAQTKGTRRKSSFCNGNDQLKITKNWYGGTESHMFNKLEAIATSQEPETPFLRCRISRALEPSSVGFDYMTSRVNWVVQSSAVDFLHILLLCMKWLFQEFRIDGRFSISIHDEIRYIVKEDHVYKAAMALQLSNLIARAYFTAALGLDDLPASVAFFTSIEIDKCIRKDVNHDCVTPSNPLGLEKGYGVPVGQSLDIHHLAEIFDRESDDSDFECQKRSL